MVTERDLAKYEAFIHTHAARVAGDVDDDYDDIVQAYRIKVWYALERFDPTKWPRHGAEEAERRFVFMCLKRAEKDVLKKRRRPEVFPEQMPEGACGHGEVYGAIDGGEVRLPDTLTKLELRVIVLLYRDYSQAEARRRLGLEKREMERMMVRIRDKLAAWRPATEGALVIRLADFPRHAPTRIAA